MPGDYTSASNADALGTIWLGYVQSDLVTTLAVEIKAPQSAFYTGLNNTVGGSLAQRVDSSFSLLSVPDPNAAPDGSTGSDAAGTGATSNDGKDRQDAIIGVVSALGAIALMVLVFLVYRSMKRRKEMAHRRLSDPPGNVIGSRPEGREFDQDSVGGARRRSFYYAEDSLRTYGPQQQEEPMMGQNIVSQRRNVVPGTISAPVLQESSMNW